MTKRLLAYLCALLLIFALTSCSAPIDEGAGRLIEDAGSQHDEADPTPLSEEGSSDVALMSAASEPTSEPSEAPGITPSEEARADETPAPDVTAASSAQPSEAPAPESASPSETTEPSPEPTPEPEPGPSPLLVKIEGPDDALLGWSEVPWDSFEGSDKVTIFDALSAACDLYSIQLLATGLGSMKYIKSIGDHAEFSRGPLSGWVYKLNGVYASVGVTGNTVSPGDRVAFYFTFDLGKDVKDRD